jgi:hypothetical protein
VLPSPSRISAAGRLNVEPANRHRHGRKNLLGAVYGSVRRPARGSAFEGTWRPDSWTCTQSIAFLRAHSHVIVGNIEKLRVQGTARHQGKLIIVPMPQAGQVPKLMGPQEMVGKVGHGPSLGILTAFRVDNDYRTKVRWRKRTSLRRSSDAPPTEFDFVDNLDVKVHASHVGIYAMDRADIGPFYDIRRIT